MVMSIGTGVGYRLVVVVVVVVVVEVVVVVVAAGDVPLGGDFYLRWQSSFP